MTARVISELYYKYKYGKIDEYQSKIKDDVPERDEGWFKHRQTNLV